MSYWKIIPEELIDWIERRKNPERYAWLILTLTREANWGTGTYSDGVQIHKGQVRITLRKLAKKLKCSLDTIRRLVYSLEKAGWLKVHSKNNITIISLLWLTQPVHLSDANPFTSDKKPVHQPEQPKVSATKNIPHQPEHQPVQDKQQTRSPSESQPVIRNNTKNIEVIRNKKQYEDKHTENNSAPPQNSGSNSEEGKKIDRGIVERLTEEIIREFKVRYKKRYNRYPVIDRGSRQRVIDTLLLSAENEEELADIVKNAISKIPAFFFLTDKWVMKQGYSFFAFSYRLGDLLSKPVNKPNVNEGWSREEKVGEAALW